MADAYVTLNEAAELEGTTYATMQRRVHRNPEKFLIDKEQRETGGKEMIMVAISSLSKKARTAWKEREKLKAVAEAPVQEADQAGETPWYVEEDIDWYIENRKEDWYKAMELGNIVREFLEYDERGRTEFAETFAQERLGKGKRTLYRYTKAYQEASAWADKMHKQDGGNYDFFKVLCLCRKPKEAGTFPSFTPEVKQVIKNIWFNKEFAQNQGTREMLYEKLQAIANINHWEKIPSYQGEQFKTPKSCFENSEKYFKACPPKSYATILMMKSERRFVRNVGIKIGDFTYRSDDLCDYINSYVDVKYDPHDMATIYVFRDGKQVCEAYSQELMVFASENGVEQKALKEHLGRQKRQLKKDKETVQEANVSFTEMNEQYVGFNETTGGIELMISGKSDRQSGKVIAIPTDKTYQNGFRGTSRKDEPEEENEYINRKAEEALKALRAL